MATPPLGLKLIKPSRLPHGTRLAVVGAHSQAKLANHARAIKLWLWSGRDIAVPRQQFAVLYFNYEANFVGLEWVNWLMRFTPKGERIASGLIRPSDSFQTENQRSIQRNSNSHFV